MDVALLSPVNPFDPRDGHRMAVASDVKAILDNGLSLGVVSFLYDRQEATPVDCCDSRYFSAAKGSFAARLVRGLFAPVPLSSERLYTKESTVGVRRALKDWKPNYVIVDDLSMAGYIPHVRELAPHAKVILRTHNVMRDVRREQLEKTKGPTRIAVRLDSDRYHAFERASLGMADHHWAITQNDADRVTELYGVKSALLSVSIPMERYTSIDVNEGRNNHFIHVGTLDFRRHADLESFLRTCWPKVRAADADASITFAGSVHGKGIEAPGVTYAGRVDDDAQIYRKGRFALNFQQSTGGVKLKTLTSLAAGRTLISTERGIEGLAITSGKHYWDMSTFLSSRLKDVLADASGLRKIADTGRAWVEAHHSRRAIAHQFASLMHAV